jgi:hypothetical protein
MSTRSAATRRRVLLGHRAQARLGVRQLQQPGQAPHHPRRQRRSEGTLTVKKNVTLLGVAVTSGLTGDLCWAVSFIYPGSSVRVKALDPAEF